MIVEPQISDRGGVNIFIDNTTTVTVDLPGNRDRARAAVSLAIYTVGQPPSENEPIPRHELVLLFKLTTEAALDETKTLLGWQIDTKRLIVSLPDHKHKYCKANFQKILNDKQTNYETLDTIIGRLTNITVIMQPILHF